MPLPKITPSSHLFVFLRHGESTGNAEKRHQGQADFPLTKLGINQAKKLASVWKNQVFEFDHAISSPLSRAEETGTIITKILKTDLVFDPIWMERDNGELAGFEFEEAREKLPQPEFTSLYQPIGRTGESIWELYLRAGKALNQLMEKPPGYYLIISHGGLLNMVVHAALGLTPQANFEGPHFRFSNTGYTMLKYNPENDTRILLGHNNTSHLVD